MAGPLRHTHLIAGALRCAGLLCCFQPDRPQHDRESAPDWHRVGPGSAQGSTPERPRIGSASTPELNPDRPQMDLGSTSASERPQIDQSHSLRHAAGLRRSHRPGCGDPTDCCEPMGGSAPVGCRDPMGRSAPSSFPVRRAAQLNRGPLKMWIGRAIARMGLNHSRCARCPSPRWEMSGGLRQAPSRTGGILPGVLSSCRNSGMYLPGPRPSNLVSRPVSASHP